MSYNIKIMLVKEKIFMKRIFWMKKSPTSEKHIDNGDSIKLFFTDAKNKINIRFHWLNSIFYY